tara:strand:- start:1484 stop:1783 length:300 start_codon:yes stop_codon:yes gene_type:complete
MSKNIKSNSINSITSDTLDKKFKKQSKNIVSDDVNIISTSKPTKKSNKKILDLIKHHFIEDPSTLDYSLSDRIIYYDKGSHLNLIKFKPLKEKKYKKNI